MLRLHVLSLLLHALSLLVFCGNSMVTAEEIVIESAGDGGRLADVLCSSSSSLRRNTTVLLRPGTHFLDAGDFCVFRDLRDITIRGSSSRVEAVIECTADTGRGFLFSNIVNLNLENIAMRHCGQTIPSDVAGNFNNTGTYFGPGQKAVLLFDHCTNIKLRSVTIDEYYGLAIVSINALRRAELREVIVTNSRAYAQPLCSEEVTDLSCSGAGIAFTFTDSPITRQSTGNANANNNFVFLDFVDTVIADNHLSLPNATRSGINADLRDATVERPFLLTGSNGLFLYASQMEYEVNITVDNCFIENNKGDMGAAVALFHDTIQHTLLNIKHSFFSNNEVFGEAGGGGGLLFAFIVSIDFDTQYPDHVGPDEMIQTLTIYGCIFDRNSGIFGGAIFISTTPQNIVEYSVVIRESIFTDNCAEFGPAIFSSGLPSTFASRDPHIVLEDVDMYGNRPITDATVQDSAVLLFIGISSVRIIGSYGFGSIFSNNSMSVLLTSSTNIILIGRITFENNVGFNGGAISMYDSSILFFHEGSNILFRGNRAVRLGGAIYANSLGSSISQTCVLQVIGEIAGPSSSPNITVTFQNNYAGESGNSIFGDPLFDCSSVPEASILQSSVFDDNAEVYDSIFRFPSTVGNNIPEVTSSPERICICSNGTYNPEECQDSINTTVIPGETFYIELVPLDSSGTPVFSVLLSEIDSESSEERYSLGPDQDIRTLSGRASCTSTSFAIFGPENGNIELTLFPATISSKTMINLTIDSCPPGFILNSKVTNNFDLEQCECCRFVLDTIDSVCNMTTYTIQRRQQVWFGLHEEFNTSSDVVFVSTCPINYCDDSITEVDLRIPNHLCQPGRTGLLCGACDDGLSTVFGSADCKKCSNAWIAMVLVFMVAGIFLVCMLFALDITVRHGTITGLIFYANVVSVNANIFFRGTGQGFLFVFISLLNLELGFPLCFYDGMSETAKLGFQYIFPAYLLLISVIMIVLIRNVKFVRKLTYTCGIQVLATLFYLSFGKILRTVIDTLSFATLYSDTFDPVTIWLFDGNIHYFEGIHLFLFIVAVVITIVFLIPYPFYLLFVSIIQRFHNSQRLKPFLDAYLAPYKDGFRFWFGMRIVILLMVCVVFAVKGTDDPGLNLLIQQIFIIIFLLLLTYCRPFKSTTLGLLHMFFLLNFIILALITVHIVDIQDLEGKQEQLVTVMVGTVFVVFCGIMAYHTFLALRKFPIFEKKSDEYINRIKEWYERRRGIEKVTPAPESTDSVIEMKGKQRTQKKSTTSLVPTSSDVNINDPTLFENSIPNTRFSQFREPVLEYVTV